MSDNDTRVLCKYGTSCYQKNEAHHKKYKHPTPNTLNKISAKDDSSSSVSSTSSVCKRGVKTGNTLTGWLKNAPNKKQKLEENVPVVASDESKEDSVESTKNDGDICSNNVKQTAADNGREERVHSKPQQAGNCDSTNSIETKSPPAGNINSISLVPIKMDAETKCKRFFLVDMPNDLKQFWKFCESVGGPLLLKGNPLDALTSVGLKLVGPFEILAGKFNENVVYNSSALLRHYRFYYDPPEFQTVIVRTNDSSEYHMGYFRDDPKEKPVFVASNCASENGVIKPIAENLFGAVNVYLEEYKQKADPFVKLKVIRLQNLLTAWAKKENITLSTSTVAMKRREAKVVARTFHKAGLVVPVDMKTDLGYRELVESNATIQTILKALVNSNSEDERKTHFSKLYPIITFANIANDECDFGTSLELGLDLFTFGSSLLHETVKGLMTTAYRLLNREEFATIIEAHLEDRRKGSNLSIFSKN